jgi:hypothetical protein
MSGLTVVDINNDTLDRDETLSDEWFNVALGATLVLASDLLDDDAIEGAGGARLRGSTDLDRVPVIGGGSLLVNAGVVDEGGAQFELGHASPDAASVRNLAGATWTLDNSARVTRGSQSEFVNLGLLQVTNDYSYFDANFCDRGGTILIDGDLYLEDPARFVDDHIEGAGFLELKAACWSDRTFPVRR